MDVGRPADPRRELTRHENVGRGAQQAPINRSCSEVANMYQHLKARLEQSFKLTFDLAAHLEEEFLSLDLPNLPSNRIAGQFWCVVGARESYTRAIETGGWKGFSCSLLTPRLKQSVLGALDSSAARLMNEIDFSALNQAQAEFAFGLLEHEVQHHGQLIRFVYGNTLTFPDSWHRRYSV